MNETARYRHNPETERLSPPASFGGGSLPPVPASPDAEAVGAWLRWHAVELVGVAGPLALALLVSGWLVLLAAPAVGLWVAQETRQRRARTRPQLGTAERGALTSPDPDIDTGDVTGSTSGQENER